MPQIFFIADTHFGHANVLKHDKRPFADIEALTSVISSAT